MDLTSQYTQALWKQLSERQQTHIEIFHGRILIYAKV